MDKPGFFRNGVMVKLPPGFRFHPTDEELVMQYLRRKVYSCPLPASIIPEIDLGKHDPWELPGASEQEQYYFNLRESKYPSGSRHNRAASSGYWKATGRDKQISVGKGGQVVGMKKVLVFYQGKPPRGCRTDWIMHEYRLAGAVITGDRNPIIKSGRDWVLCRIFLKKRAAKMNTECSRGFIDFFKQASSSSSSSSSASSCVTDVSDGSNTSEEENSCSTDSSSGGREA
ncbi:NAC domain-containing protein [Dioscorea alata]|uniref:NAC domain-containing protein n=1 Tax=Dioscorea alata TaxID=55571 RepID=A0ACB7W772_DIOAL|nr:NAC domain-containing protein [Dioscorea alata]